MEILKQNDKDNKIEEINKLKKEIDSLKLKCINQEKLLSENNNLSFSLRKKEEEIKKLNETIE